MTLARHKIHIDNLFRMSRTPFLLGIHEYSTEHILQCIKQSRTVDLMNENDTFPTRVRCLINNVLIILFSTSTPGDVGSPLVQCGAGVADGGTTGLHNYDALCSGNAPTL